LRRLRKEFVISGNSTSQNNFIQHTQGGGLGWNSFLSFYIAKIFWLRVNPANPTNTTRYVNKTKYAQIPRDWKDAEF
jgi:hypothetical protein